MANVIVVKQNEHKVISTVQQGLPGPQGVQGVAGNSIDKKVLNDAIVDTTLVLNDIVDIKGREAEGDGGGNDYVVVSNTTGTIDNGSIIQLTGVPLRLKGLFSKKDISIKQFGAKCDLIQDDTVFFQSTVDYCNTVGRGTYVPAPTRTTAKIVVSGFGQEVYGDNPFSCSIVADFTTDAVLQLKESRSIVRALTIDSSTARRAVTNTSGYGIQIEGSDDTNGSLLAWCQLEQVIIKEQPSHGSVMHAIGTDAQNCEAYDNRGHGFLVDSGNGIGRTTLLPQGMAEFKNCRAEGNGGHGYCLGNPSDDSTNYVFRIGLVNCESAGNALDSNVRFSLHENYIVGEQLEAVRCAMKGSSTVGGAFVAGRQIECRQNRFLDCFESYEIGKLAGLSTIDVLIDQFRVIQTTAPAQNPAITVDPSFLPTNEHIRVKQGMTPSITKLVTDTARDNYVLEYEFDTNRKWNGISDSMQTAGTFTPTFEFSTLGDMSVSYSGQVGQYVKVGNLMWIHVVLSGNITYTTASGILLITGFAGNGYSWDSADRFAFNISDIDNIGVGTGIQFGVRVNSNGVFRITVIKDNGITAGITPTELPTGTTVAVTFSGFVNLI